MATMWRKLKKSFSSKFSFRSKSSSATSSITTGTTESSSTASRAPRLPPQSASSSSSLSARISRSFSLQSSSKTCAICLRSVRRGQGQAIFFAECSHSFHFNCIVDNVKHGNHLCPICRSKWKNVPFQAPTNDTESQHNGVGQARVSPYNSPPIQPELEHFSDDEALPAVSASLTSPSEPQNVTIKSFSEYPAVSALDSLDSFGVLVRIRAPPLDNNHYRAPIDLVTVLDVSGSMAGKLTLLKRAVCFIIQNLSSSDRLSIVTFSSSARRILPLRRMSDSGHGDAINVVNTLSSNGGTNIVAGLNKGVRVLEERRECNLVASIILLSDGRDTRCCSGQNGLEYLRLSSASICPSNSAHGEESQQPIIPVHTFGFGSDHDSIAMHAISDASGGTFSFIESIDILQDAFARCIGGLLSVVAQDVQLKVKSISPGVQIGSIPSGMYKNKIFDQGHQAVIDIGNLYAEEEKEFLVYLSIPLSSATDDQERLESTSLVGVSCLHKDSMSLNMVQAEGERVEIRRPQVLSHTDKIACLEVDRQKNRLRVTKAIADALGMAEMGDLRGAQELLAEQQSALLSTPSAQAGDGLCNLLEAELREIRQRMENRKLYEHSGRSYVLSGMSSHLSQRATTRGHTTTFTLVTNREGGNSSTNATTSYETPSMSSMVSKSQEINLATSGQPQRLDKSCSLINRH